ncbi:MAG TPA: hypothetical protein VFF09_01465 [archaeon]|nr:hypothetical protein [archaeon]
MPGKRPEEPWRPKRPDPKKPLVETAVKPIRGQGFPLEEIARRAKAHEEKRLAAHEELNKWLSLNAACAEGALSAIEHFHPNFNKTRFIENYWDYEAALENFMAYSREKYTSEKYYVKIKGLEGKPQAKGVIEKNYEERNGLEKRARENRALMRENLMKAFWDESIVNEYLSIISQELEAYSR